MKLGINWSRARAYVPLIIILAVIITIGLVPLLPFLIFMFQVLLATPLGIVLLGFIGCMVYAFIASIYLLIK